MDWRLQREKMQSTAGRTCGGFSGTAAGEARARAATCEPGQREPPNRPSCYAGIEASNLTAAPSGRVTIASVLRKVLLRGQWQATNVDQTARRHVADFRRTLAKLSFRWLRKSAMRTRYRTRAHAPSFHVFFMEMRAISSKSLKRWWARQGLNLRPHPCEGCALPLSYAPASEADGPGQGRAFATQAAPMTRLSRAAAWRAASAPVPSPRGGVRRRQPPGIRGSAPAVRACSPAWRGRRTSGGRARPAGLRDTRRCRAVGRLARSPPPLIRPATKASNGLGGRREVARVPFAVLDPGLLARPFERRVEVAELVDEAQLARRAAIPDLPLGDLVDALGAQLARLGDQRRRSGRRRTRRSIAASPRPRA